MAIHIVKSPKVISRKNAKNYLSEHMIFPKTITTIEEHAFINEVVDVFIGLENVENVHEDAFK